MKSAQLKAGLLTSLLIACFFTIFQRIEVSTDLGLFLPDPETRFDRLLRHQLDNGASSNIVLLGFSGLPGEQLADFNIEFSAALNESPFFSKVTNSAAALGDEALAFLESNRYLLTHNDLSESFSVSALKTALQSRLNGLASSAAALEKKYLQRDPSGEIMGLLKEWQGKISRHKRPLEKYGAWFSNDELRSLVLAEIATDITDMSNQIDAVNALREIYAKLKVPDLEVVMAGPAVFAVESSEDIKADVKNLTIIAVAIVVLFLLCVYRSFRMMALVVCPLAMGVAAATAAVLIVFGNVHGITLAFGITLAGVAVDYPIHLLPGMGAGATSDPARVKKIWRTLRLGVLSTVVAYGAFLASGFGGLQQLGLFTVVGLIVAALFSRWVLPFLNSKGREAMPGLAALHGCLKTAGQKACRVQYLVPAALLISLFALLFSQRPVLHLNVDSLSPINEIRRAEGRMLRSDLGFWYGGSMMLVVAKDKETVLRNSELLQPYLDELVSEGTIHGYDMAAHFLPSQQSQKANLQNLQDIDTIERNLSIAMQGTPFKPAVFEPFIRELAELSNRRPIDTENLDKTFIGKKLAPLLFDFDRESGGVILLHGVSDQALLTKFSEQHEGLYYMHLKSASTDLVARSVERISFSMLVCVLIIYISLGCAFRSMIRPLKIMIPTFAAAVTAAAILVFTGNPLSIFHLVSLLLVVGLGLDYALFFNRLPDNAEEWDTTFKALWVCGFTTILVFGILMYSNTPPLKAIGVTVGIGAFLSMIFAAMWSASPTKQASAATLSADG